jgi:hypothetical protein
VPNLTREEALLIFSYTDNTIYRRLNAFMRWDKEVLKSMTIENIKATKNLISQLEHVLEKMPDMEWKLVYRWDDWVWWIWKKWEEIELKSFTSVANGKNDTFLSKEKNILVIVEWIKWRVKDITSLALIPQFWGKFPNIPKTTNEWIILPNSVVKIVWKNKIKQKWDFVDKIKTKQIK